MVNKLIRHLSSVSGTDLWDWLDPTQSACAHDMSNWLMAYTPCTVPSVYVAFSDFVVLFLRRPAEGGSCRVESNLAVSLLMAQMSNDIAGRTHSQALHLDPCMALRGPPDLGMFVVSAEDQLRLDTIEGRWKSLFRFWKSLFVFGKVSSFLEKSLPFLKKSLPI